MSQLKQLSINGLWQNNPALVQLLGLCPLLAVSNTTINGLGLGIATIFVLVSSNLLVACLRSYIPSEIRIPIFVILIATLVTAVEMLMNAFTHQLFLSLGIFIPLIVTNCAIIGRAEAYASKNTPINATIDGLMHGLGFALVLLLLGLVREVIGMGTIFAGSTHLFGDVAANWQVNVSQFDQPMLLAILPPGAFIILAFFIALKNYLDNKVKQKASQPQTEQLESANEPAKA